MSFFQRLFSQPRTENKESSHTEPEKILLAQEQNSQTTGLQLPPGIYVGELSDVGQKRERNEDSFFTFQSLLQYDLATEPFGLFIVADGMGGHQKGEIASSLAVRIAAGSLLKEVFLPYLTGDQSANTRPLNEALTLAVEQANTVVIDEVPDGGTTLTIVLLLGNNAYIAHIGDSRTYILKDDTLKQVTLDHSLAQRLEDLGQSSTEEVKQVQNVLYRAIGQSDSIEVDTHMQHVPPGASLLLCSDGLWGLVEDVEIKAILKAASTPQEACQQLVAAANDKGGFDNITAIVVSIGIEN